MPQQQPVPGAAGSTNPYDPSEVEVNRSRQQGAGMGQRDLDAQHDPDRRPEVAPVGTTAEAALDIEDELQRDLDYDALKGQPQEDVQGRKTLQKNREIIRGGA